MNKGYLVGDNIALAMENAANTARANTELKRQQGYNAGDIGLRNSALAELRKVDPENPLLRYEAVRDRIYSLAESEFYRSGWAKATALQADPKEVHAQLLEEFEATRAHAIVLADQDPETCTRGIFRLREVYRWNGQEFKSPEEAADAKQRELSRLRATQFGDDL
ncbi:hypothetical protein [Hydrogenophaga sp. 2FB]|uniref:hypothetical protein n=1 Tax=Hydrogenophaga sp. 2FB TaxID=2502187 RepID=UPI0010F6CC8B|nr:hypothetical protein [Hydrogenophaga sp. 2FB]